MRPVLLLPFLLVAACSGEPSTPPQQAAAPSLDQVTEKPGDWSSVTQMVGRRPFESGLLEVSPVAVDLQSALGSEFSSFEAAMMQAGPLTRVGPVLATRSDEAWLVLDPADRAFHAALLGPEGWREWHTAGADVPIPRELKRAASDQASARTER